MNIFADSGSLQHVPSPFSLPFLGLTEHREALIDLDISKNISIFFVSTYYRKYFKTQRLHNQPRPEHPPPQYKEKIGAHYSLFTNELIKYGYVEWAYLHWQKITMITILQIRSRLSSPTHHTIHPHVHSHPPSTTSKLEARFSIPCTNILAFVIPGGGAFIINSFYSLFMLMIGQKNYRRLSKISCVDCCRGY